MKPNKTIYSNQKEVHDFMIKKIKEDYLKKYFKVYLIGSLASKTFGKYDKEYERYLGSDIDLVVIPKSNLSSKLKYKGEFHNWHKAYFGGIIKFKETEHPVNFIVPFKQSLSLFLKKAKELNWKVERLK